MEEGCNARVLVLNRVWQAVNIVGAKRAFSLLFQDHAQVINTADGDFRVMSGEQWIMDSLENPPTKKEVSMKTVRYDLRVPKILLLRNYSALPMKEVKFTRYSIFERDGHTCQYCGKMHREDQLNLDHVIPRDRGGRTTWENIVTSCIRCNSKKANRLPHEAGMRLNHKPGRPKYRPFVSFMVKDRIDDSWQHFLKTVGS